RRHLRQCVALSRSAPAAFRSARRARPRARAARRAVLLQPARPSRLPGGLERRALRLLLDDRGLDRADRTYGLGVGAPVPATRRETRRPAAVARDGLAQARVMGSAVPQRRQTDYRTPGANG